MNLENSRSGGTGGERFRLVSSRRPSGATLDVVFAADCRREPSSREKRLPTAVGRRDSTGRVGSRRHAVDQQHALGRRRPLGGRSLRPDRRTDRGHVDQHLGRPGVAGKRGRWPGGRRLQPWQPASLSKPQGRAGSTGVSPAPRPKAASSSHRDARWERWRPAGAAAEGRLFVPQGRTLGALASRRRRGRRPPLRPTGTRWERWRPAGAAALPWRVAHVSMIS